MTGPHGSKKNVVERGDVGDGERVSGIDHCEGTFGAIEGEGARDVGRRDCEVEPQLSFALTYGLPHTKYLVGGVNHTCTLDQKSRQDPENGGFFCNISAFA